MRRLSRLCRPLLSLCATLGLVGVSHAASTPLPTHYECWLDDDVSNAKRGELKGGEGTFSIDMGDKKPGLHLLSVRGLNDDGKAGPIAQYLFSTSDMLRAEGFEYWFDDNHAGRTILRGPQIQQTVSIPMSDLTPGLHTLCYRAFNSRGRYGEIYQYGVAVHTGQTRIKGYRVMVDEWEKYFSIDPASGASTQTYMFPLPTAELPSGPELAALLISNLEIRDGYVSLESLEIQKEATLQTQLESGHWMAPVTDTLAIRGPRVAARDMRLFEPLSIPKPAVTTFEAFRVNITEQGTWYLRGNQDAYAFVVKEGQPALSGKLITPDELRAGKALDLTAGEWYGMLASVPVNDANPYPDITLRMADSPDDTLPAPTFSLEAEALKLTISCADAEAEILYSIGSENVAANGKVYDKANGLILEARDQVVYAIARRQGYNDSEIASYQFVLSAHQTATPVVRVNEAGTHVVMTCATDGARIRYNVSTDGTVPAAPASASEDIAYIGEIQLQGNAIYAARAFAEGKYRSEAATLDVNNQALKQPEAEYHAHAVWITAEDREATIMYSVDSEACDRTYDAVTGVPVEGSCVITFMAVREHYNDSPKGTFEFRLDDYKADAPWFTPRYEAGELTITAPGTSTVAAELTMESGGVSITQTQQSETRELTVTDLMEGETESGYILRRVSAVTIPDDPDLYQSDAVEFVARYYSVPVLNHHGSTLDVETESGQVYLIELEGSENLKLDTGIISTADISAQDFGCLYTVTLRAAGPEAFPSAKVEYSNEAYYDAHAIHHALPTAGIRNPGHLAEAFADEDAASEIALSGPLSETDFVTLAEVGSEIGYLDLTEVSVSKIPDEALSSLRRLNSVLLPRTLSESSRPFVGNPRLTSLVWSGTEAMPEGIAAGVGNPNLLVYADREESLPTDAPCRVTLNNGQWQTESLTLTRGHAFGVLYPFRASEVSMMMSFTQSTPIGGCEGWETIALPFDVETITHETNGAAIPFARFDGDLNGPRPFWLYEGGDSDDGNGNMWRSATQILAGRPYLLSMPNHESYDDDWNLGGNVTFAAKDVMLTPENCLEREEMLMNHSFVSLFLPFDEEYDDMSGVLGLNAGRDDLYGDNGLLASGSAFHKEVKPEPLSGYVRTDFAERYIPVWGEESGTGAMLNPEALVIVPVDGGVRITSGSDRKVRIHTTTGLLLRTIELRGGVTEKVSLSPEVYIIEGRKILTH